jgi:hypothetical protein
MDDIDLVDLAMSVEYEAKIRLKKLGVKVTAGPLPALLVQQWIAPSPIPQDTGSTGSGALAHAASSPSEHKPALRELMEAIDTLESNKPSTTDDLVEWPNVGGLLQELYKASASLQGEALEAVQTVIYALHTSLDACRGL